ncbi:MAG: tyrosine-type recombinase/integrase [Clostridia bacterium]|nr:tyrosine-type recombinase/integrase [Clostridia bacterium]
MKKLNITEELLNKFASELENQEKSAATREKYMRDARRFAQWTGESDVDKALMLEYKAELGCEYSPRSANSMLASLNSLFRFAGRDDLRVKQFRLQREAYCSENSELTREEYARLVAVAERRDERCALMLQTICCTGIRISELRYITVEAARHGETTVSCKGKTRKIFIVSALRDKLLRFAAKQGTKHGPVFITQNGLPIDRSNVWRRMKRLCKEACVPPQKVFPHNLRHLFARVFYENERDIAALADILGHSSVNTTRIYIITTGTEHKRKMENMNLIT